MTTFQVDAAAVKSSSGGTRSIGEEIASQGIPVPDPRMYGQLVGSAAQDCEPATTTAFNDLLHCLGGLIMNIADRIDQSGQCYVDVEQDNARLAGTIGKATL